MDKANYTRLAQEIVSAVGGKNNIISVANCMTRLRFVLKDESIPDKDKVTAIKGVKGVMNQGGQYQVVIGTHVNEVIKDVKKAAQITDDSQVNKEDLKLIKKDSLWNRFFKTISGCIMPMLGPMIAGGILKGILVILTTFGILTSDSGTYQLLYAAADSILYFMPVIVGFTCGKIFDCNPYVTAVIGAAFLYPDLVTAVAAEGGIQFLGIQVAAATYSSTFLPILLASYIAAKLEKLAKKFIPSMLQLMLIPTFVLAVTVPISWLIIGPVMNALSEIMSSGITGIFNFSPIIGGVLIGAFWQLMVVLGLHAAFIPILINNLVTQGSDPVNAIMGLTVWALAGAALGYALKVKDPEKKTLGFGSMASALCGVTEPTIYSIALPNIKVFAGVWIGGGIAGGILGALGGRLYAFAGDGLFRIPGMINPDGLDVSFFGFIVCALISFTVSTVLSYVFTDKGKTAEDIPDSQKNHQEAGNQESMIIYAPVKGTGIIKEQIADETFASGAMGDGVGIDPIEGVVTAPVSGKVISVVETKHAIGIESKEGLQVLIHVGVDTVKMNGDGFTMHVAEGQEVNLRQKLITFDLEKIKKAGYDTTTAVLLINSDDYNNVHVDTGICNNQTAIITVN